MILSLRQVSIQYGMNTSHIDVLTATGALTVIEGSHPLRPKYLRSQVDGCYWHGCATCGFPGVPRTVRNDKSKDAYLRASGWTIVRVRGHTITRDPEASVDVVRQSLNTIRGTHDARTISV